MSIVNYGQWVKHQVTKLTLNLAFMYPHNTRDLIIFSNRLISLFRVYNRI